MLNEKTSSANNLRIQSSRRHQIRNLRAKVRSMLPQEICPKESKRIHKTRKFDKFLRPNAPEQRHSQHSHHQQKDRRLIKQLQKLTEKELEEINENKYYFLGNQKIIEHFDHFVKDFHPKIKEHEWAPPKIKRSVDMPFGFVPPFYSLQKGSRRSLTSTQKRGSTATSVYFQKSESVVKCQVRSQGKSKEFESNFMERKQAIEEQLKVKRQINSVHMQRQQHIAEVNRNSLIKAKVEKAKVVSSLEKFSKHKQKSDTKHAYEEHDILALAAKLRKICLKKYKRKATKQCQSAPLY